ncbi:hypothetical protein [Streptomyces sp. NBC_01615]|uniref:ABC transporter ATP-binding protein n=1 Tax=Streptomyces sp. NBC_01615 TaxID=2975898 RepID=UPI00386A72E0
MNAPMEERPLLDISGLRIDLAGGRTVLHDVSYGVRPGGSLGLVGAQVLNLLADLREELGIGYLVGTHDLAVVQQVTDELIVMHQGRVVEHGTTDQVLTAPEHPYTRDLLAAVPHEGWLPTRRR